MRSHALGLGGAGAEGSHGLPESPLQKVVGGNRAQGWKGWTAQRWKWHPPRSPMSTLTLNVSDGKTAQSFPEMPGHHLIKKCK